MERRSTRGLLWAGVLMGTVACSTDNSTDADSNRPDTGADLHTSKTGLQRAQSCDDLLLKIQNDAIAKLDLVVETIKNDPDAYYGGGRGVVDGGWDDGVGDPDLGAPGAPPTAGEGEAPSDGDNAGGGGDTGGEGPTGSSDTNTQVAGVDEADIVKLVNSGSSMYLLHGNRLLKLKSWPAAATALEGEGLEIEGTPSEMFVNDAGKAVVFSSVWGYGQLGGKGDYYCGPDYCGGSNFTKITIADLSGDTPKTERELYYEGHYVSSRRYEKDGKNMVRAVLQASPHTYNLFAPDLVWTDAFGNRYPADVIAEQLDQWRNRQARDIRGTKLENWMPIVQEAKDGALANVGPDCGSYYVPMPGLSDYGLTHVLAVDANDPSAPVGGVTILGATSTVYSNADTLVLAQPDYRAFRGDFGFIDRQQTALHVFGLSAADTNYTASGFVPGHLAGNIPQFAIDVKDDVVRVATTGWERTNPDATEFSEDWWRTEPVNRLVTARAQGNELKVVDELSPLGHEGETIRSSRFLGNRGYIVTFRQTDPLIVTDLSNPADLKVLGELEIPGFSEYMHPLDESHLVTLGQNASLWGLQLQIFDVSDATNPVQKHVLDLGEGSGSEGSHQHKAFTFYAKEKLLALPLYSYSGPNGFSSGLTVIRVDADAGFDQLGTIDHSALLEQQRCGYCDAWGGCYEELCYGYYPEVRRGHFVSGSDGTYVYSFSYGGVLVHDVAELGTALATVDLPDPQWGASSWYGETSGGRDGSDGWSEGDDVDRPVDGGVAMPTEPAPEEDAGSANEG